jgi:FMN-dependent NADH-azoreductase
MPHLLHIIASPSAGASRSRRVAESFIETWKSSHPGATSEDIDLWSVDLPSFDAEMIGAKFAVLRSQQATDKQMALWQRAGGFARQMNRADRLVFSVPMWNFGVPYRLKHYIDVVTLPEENWRWSPGTGYQPLLSGKKAALVYSSAGAHPLAPHETQADHLKSYMKTWLAFIGISDVLELNVAPTLAAPEAVARTVDESLQAAQDAAPSF